MTEKTLDFSNPLGYPIREDFGSGCYFRGIKLEKRSDEKGNFILGELEDSNHGFRVYVYVDNEKVVDIRGEAIRTPLTTCFGAMDVLKKLIGCPLGLSLKDLAARVQANEHCTHWLDLTLLAINHAKRSTAIREYRVEAKDEAGKPEWVIVYRDGLRVLSWLVHNWTVIEPKSLARKTLFKGFSAWASEFSEGDDELLEAALVLQKGYFVSTARRFDLNKVEGEPAIKHDVMHGACYSYQEPQLSKAVRAKNSVRDFSHDQIQLLRFS